MRPKSSTFILYAAVCAAALLTPNLKGQTTPTCNGLPATIVATASGTILGTQGDDVIVGTAGDDRIFGLGGNDTICGLAGNDQISGGYGNDNVFGQAGNDTLFWSPGDGNDRIEGSTETDTLQVTGSSIGETLELSANGTRLRLFRNVANIVLDIAGVERVTCDTRGGSDLVVVNLPGNIGVQQITFDLEGSENSNTPDGVADSVIVFGGAGNDQIAIGGSGNTLNVTGAGPAIQIRNPEAALDTLSVYGIEGSDRISAQGLAAGLIRLIVEGGPGNDMITGSAGADILAGSEGDDTLIWTLGTPADAIGGEAGKDTLQVIGSAAADNVTFAAGPLEAQIVNVSDGANFLTDVEQIVLQAKGGADQVFVGTLAGALLQTVTLDLRASSSGTAGDGAADSIVINGTQGVDNISISGSAGAVMISGLSPAVVIQGAEGTRDTLTVNTGVEADIVNAQALAANVVRLTLRGGQGTDRLTGSAGDDLMVWSPGDGSDVIEGGPGTDTLQFNGSNIGENISIAANGPRLRFTRDVAAIVLDVNAVERVNFLAVGGADTVLLADLSATAVRQVGIDFAGPTNTAGDGQPDTVLIAAQSPTAVSTSLAAGAMNITWGLVKISVTGVEPSNDRLTLQTFGAPAVVSSLLESRPRH